MERFSCGISVLKFAGRGRNWSISFIRSIWSVWLSETRTGLS